VIIPSGHAGAYYSVFFGGTDTERVRTEGLQLKAPWDKIYDYDVRLQQVPYDYSVIAKDGLLIQFSVTVRCHPRVESLGLLQKSIGPDYIAKVIIPDSQQAIRQVVGDNSAETIYTTSASVLEEAIDRVIEETSGNYVIIDTILIRGVEIPPNLQAAIQAKLTQDQNALAYNYILIQAEKEAQRKRIEAGGIRDFQAIVTPGISENFLRWKGIEATLELSKSDNTKVIVIGSQNGLPLILDTSTSPASARTNPMPPLLPPPSPTAAQRGTPPTESSPTPSPTPVRSGNLLGLPQPLESAAPGTH
jgi:regulator of protease activity HflC (stomatin/prohibitin superfamily)